MILFKRKIYKKLLEWKANAQGTKALLIEGARRIGKSTIINHYGCENKYRCQYRDYLYNIVGSQNESFKVIH